MTWEDKSAHLHGGHTAGAIQSINCEQIQKKKKRRKEHEYSKQAYKHIEQMDPVTDDVCTNK